MTEIAAFPSTVQNSERVNNTKTGIFLPFFTAATVVYHKYTVVLPFLLFHSCITIPVDVTTMVSTVAVTVVAISVSAAAAAAAVAVAAVLFFIQLLLN